MTKLSDEEEKQLIALFERRLMKHREAQKRYREKVGKEVIKQRNKEYYEKQRALYNQVKKDVVPTQIDVPEIIKEPVVDKRTRHGRKAAQNKANDVKPRYQSRGKALETSTIDGYMAKADVLQRIFTGKSLSQPVKAELRKLFNDNDNLNDKLILDEMTYIKKDIQPTIDKLREYYKNDNTFKHGIIVLTAIASHLKKLDPSVYQTLSRVGIHMNKEYKKQRAKNLVAEEDEGKIIDLTRDVLLENLKKLEKPYDRLIYGLYTLMPARRLDWRLVKLTDSTKPTSLPDHDNYLTMSKQREVIFNDYKTSHIYHQQVFPITDTVLNTLIDNYIKEKKVKPGEYIFHMKRDKREPQGDTYFSKAVGDVFFKVYGIRGITVRHIRSSHSSHLWKNNPTKEEAEALAYAMAHSLNESLSYMKK